MAKGRWKYSQRIPVYAGLCLTLLMTLGYLSLSGGQKVWLERVEYLLYDWRFGWAPFDRSVTSESARIAIIDIDEASINAHGRWPWSRSTLALLFDELAFAGVAVVGLDMVLSEAQQSDLQRWINSLSDEQRADLPGLSGRYRIEPDQQLVDAISQLDVVSGFFFHPEAGVQKGDPGRPVYELTGQPANSVLSFGGYTATLPIIQSGAVASGFVSTYPDSDGSIRRTPLLGRFNDHLYPSLSLAVAQTYLLADSIDIDWVSLGRIEVPYAIRFAGVHARVDLTGRAIVPYRGPSGSYDYYSATDVMNNRLPDGALEGAIVLVGTSAAGLVDLRATPVGVQYPGVEVHANVVDALLNGEFPYRPEWEAGATFVTLLVTGLLLSVLLPGMKPVRAMLTSLALLTVVIAVNFWLWQQGLDLPLAPSMLLALVLVICNLGYGFLHESTDKQRLKGMFDQYVPPAHIDKMLEDPDAYQFQGETRDMTVLFSDIRSFTSISEDLPAHELKQLLNSYFTPVTRVLFDHDATIDKYVGDMVMAFWGAPVDDPDHAHHAVAAALAMLTVCEQLQPQFQSRGWPEIRVGIGLSSGPMNVGDMGSAYRRAYTVLGDTVNLGARLESLSRFYGVDILVSASTRDRAAAFEYRFIDRIQVKGKQQSVDVYEPIGLAETLRDSQLDELQRHQRALDLYFDQQWSAARSAFEDLLAVYDRQLYQVFVERLREWEFLPPPGWDGSFQHLQK